MLLDLSQRAKYLIEHLNPDKQNAIPTSQPFYLLPLNIKIILFSIVMVYSLLLNHVHLVLKSSNSPIQGGSITTTYIDIPN